MHERLSGNDRAARRERLRAVGPALLIALLAFTLTWDLRAQDAASRAVGAQRGELVRIVQLRQQRTGALERRVAALQASLNEAIARASGGTLQALADAEAQLAAIAGTQPLHGPGILVRLSDAPGADPGDADRRIQDVDVQAVVNALWAAGAEAIAVNGQRLVSTSAIRAAGDAILVNFQVLTSPYTVSAIAAPGAARAFGASPVAGRFRAWHDVYGLGFSIASSGDVRLPAFQGALRFRYAHTSGA